MAASRRDLIDSGSDFKWRRLAAWVCMFLTARTRTGTFNSSRFNSRLAAGFVLGRTLITKPSFPSMLPTPTLCNQSRSFVSASNRFLARSTSRFLAIVQF